MYCTLQEAYSVPSFDGGKKKKTFQVQAKASADAYDPYNADTARGQKSAIVEGFQSGKPMSQEETPVTYRGKANDYEYYRKQYGVQLPRIEGFQGSEPPMCGAEAPPVYKIPISDEAKEAYDNAMETTLNEQIPRYTPQTPEPRKVDMSKVSGYYDEELEQYLLTKDMKAAPFAAQSLPSPPPTRVEVEPVVRDTSYKPYRPINNNMIQKPVTQPPPVKDIPSREVEAEVDTENDEELEVIDEPRVKKKTIISNESWQHFWDMFLFIFAGLLVMFLCEQLFKLAMMIGMKRTVEMLEPYLK